MVINIRLTLSDGVFSDVITETSCVGGNVGGIAICGMAIVVESIGGIVVSFSIIGTWGAEKYVGLFFRSTIL